MILLYRSFREDGCKSSLPVLFSGQYFYCVEFLSIKIREWSTAVSSYFKQRDKQVNTPKRVPALPI